MGPKIKDLREITDFSHLENQYKFKKVYDNILSTLTSGYHQHEAVFHNMVRQTNFHSKDYHDVFNLVNHDQHFTTNMRGSCYIDSMYALDMFSDWNPDDAAAIVSVALNVGIPTREILLYLIQNEIPADFNKVVNLLAEAGRFETDKVEWGIFKSLGVEHPILGEAAWTYYNSLSFTPRNEYSNDSYYVDSGFLHYLYTTSLDKIADFENLVHPKDKSYRSGRFNVLYQVWKMKIDKEGFTNDLDYQTIDYLLNVVGGNHTDYSFVHKGDLCGILQKHFEADPLFLDKFKGSLVGALKNEVWAIPYVEKYLDCSKENYSFLDRVLQMNKQREQDGNTYSDATFKAAFMRCLELNAPSAFHDLETWFPHAEEGKPMQMTPITKEALAFVLIRMERNPSYGPSSIPLIAKVFPGFNTKKGRAALMNTYLPEAKTMLKLESLYSEIDMIKMLGGAATLEVKAEVLPELDF